MTALDHRIEHDGKRGHSTMCRRGDHATCRIAQAHCTCSCHGPAGQTPPEPQEPQMPEPHLTPVGDIHKLQCPDCPRSFDRPQALGRHRTATHGATPKTPPKTKRPAAKRPASLTPAPTPKPSAVADPRAVADRIAVLVEHDNGFHTIVMHNASDAKNTAALLNELGHPAWTAPLPR